MTGGKRAGDDHDDGHGRSPKRFAEAWDPWLPLEESPQRRATEITPLCSVEEQPTEKPTLVKHRDGRSTPSRSAQLDLILEALSRAPNGLTSHEIFGWIKDNRPETVVQQAESKLRSKVQKICSEESNKKTPAIRKYKIPGLRGRSFLWSLPLSTTSTKAITAMNASSAPETHEHDNVMTAASSIQGQVSCNDAESLERSIRDHSILSTFSPRRPHSSLSVVDEDISTQLMSELDASMKSGKDAPLSTCRHAVNEVPTISARVQTRAFQSSQQQARATGPALLQGPPSLQHSTTEPTPMNNTTKELYCGQLVMQIQKYSKRRADLEKALEAEHIELLGASTLADEANRLSGIARDQVAKAEQACGEAGTAQKSLSVFLRRQHEFAERKRNLERLTHKLQTARIRLRID